MYNLLRVVHNDDSLKQNPITNAIWWSLRCVCHSTYPSISSPVHLLQGPFSVKLLVKSPLCANGIVGQPEWHQNSPVTVGNSLCTHQCLPHCQIMNRGCNGGDEYTTALYTDMSSYAVWSENNHTNTIKLETKWSKKCEVLVKQFLYGQSGGIRGI